LPVDAGYLAELFRSAVQSNLDAWASAHAELDRLLDDRIAELLARMRRDLLLTGALALLSVLLAIITHRSIVPPLKRLAGIAKEVSETRNYELRIKDVARDEVGQLGAAFNNMLSELAVARDREHAAQGELARVSRLTTAGAMTASIAHEINQPLGAIVSNGNAGLRWLRKAPPNLGEVELALNDIVSDGKRASELIRSIRSMFKTDDQARTLVDVNGMIQQTLRLVQGELRSTVMLVKLDLDDNLPPVPGSQAQLQHVFLNLIMNAKEAMAPVADRARVLRIRSSIGATLDVVVTVEDNGPGIGREHDARVFEPFFTTKREGMGMGLSICRTIVEAHNGRIWASPSSPHGSIFHVALPASGSSQRIEVSTDSRNG
jgi:signal transduction histidine kinase